MRTRIEKAAADFKMWHQREPDEAVRARQWFPDQGMTKIGHAVEILYQSSKWARRCIKCDHVCEKPRCPKCNARTDPAPDVFQLYVHDCESHAPVYAPRAATGIPVEELVGSLAKKPTPFAELAFMDELTYKRTDGTTKVMRFPRETSLACASDRKTLIVLCPKPIIITGAKMRITKHGIVR
jgi:hypothetical protein